MSIEAALGLIAGLSAAFGFFWNISDRAKKQGMQDQQFISLKLLVTELNTNLTAARAEILALKVIVDRQEEELQNLRRELRDKGKI